MIVKKAEDAMNLPKGTLAVSKNDNLYPAIMDDAYVINAARNLLEQGVIGDFTSQAEILAEAINNHGWDIGSKEYVAVLSDKG